MLLLHFVGVLFKYACYISRSVYYVQNTHERGFEEVLPAYVHIRFIYLRQREHVNRKLLP